MSYLDEVKTFRKESLSSVETIITKRDGRKVKELSLDEQIPLADIDLQNCVKEFFVLDLNPDKELHEVCKRLYIGSQDAATDYEKLKENDITHILNIAAYVENQYPDAFIYKSIEMYDVPSFDISQHFKECTEFIHNAIDIESGSVLCHCNAGISRSSTVIIAYLMKYRKMSMDDALDLVVLARPVAQPNAGFLLKLKEYEEHLQTEACEEITTA